jgi:hypothetical protein
LATIGVGGQEATMATGAAVTKLETSADNGHDPHDYVVPVIHIHLPESVVKVGFYSGLAAAVAAGAVDLPLALLFGVGVAMVRHRRV